MTNMAQSLTRKFCFLCNDNLSLKNIIQVQNARVVQRKFHPENAL